MSRYIKWSVGIFCLFIFGFIAIKVYTDNVMIIDSALYNFICKYFMGNTMTSIAHGITWFGSTIGIILACIISLCIFRDKKINLCIVSNVLIVTIVNNLLKIAFMRARPDINPLVIENSYSFPSGHAMISMAVYGYLIYLIYYHMDNKVVRRVFITILAILILLIGISRIYLGVHYASDVIGGFSLSIVYLIIYCSVTKKIVKKI